MTPPVHVPGWGALLPDGSHIPQAAIDAAVDLITRCCELIEALPPETRVVLEAETHLNGHGGAE